MNLPKGLRKTQLLSFPPPGLGLGTLGFHLLTPTTKNPKDVPQLQHLQSTCPEHGNNPMAARFAHASWFADIQLKDTGGNNVPRESKGIANCQPTPTTEWQAMAAGDVE